MARSKKYVDGDGMWIEMYEECGGESYYLGWCDSGDADGDCKVGEEDHAPEHETIVATLAPLVNGDSIRRDPGGAFLFERRTDATKALAMLNAALLAEKAGRPWPSWALEAKAAGWKPPKGWTP